MIYENVEIDETSINELNPNNTIILPELNISSDRVQRLLDKLFKYYEMIDEAAA